MNWELRKLYNLIKMDAADGGGGGDSGGSDGDGGSDDGNKGGRDKTFTQEDLNRIGATEKNAGKLAALKALGFEDEASAQAFLEKARKAEKDAMTEAERIKAEKEEAEKLANSEKAKATVLEQKLEVLKANCDPKVVDDVVLLVRNRVTETVDFGKALEEVKESFPSFFVISEEDKDKGKGTGGAGNPPRKIGKEDVTGIGKRLAEKKSATASKTNYFSN